MRNARGREVFILDGQGGFPGVAVYGDTYDFSGDTGSSGTVSSKNWLANTTYSGSIFDPTYFLAKIPTDLTINTISQDTIDASSLASGGDAVDGFTWYKKTGDLTINGNLTIAGNRRVVLIVEGGNLNINGTINIASPGSGNFMTVVSKATDGSKGDIVISPTVGGGSTIHIEGIYVSGNQFKTGNGTSRLNFRGSIAAFGGLALERDLGANNANTPAESFEYAPELLFAYPKVFLKDSVVWKEVAP